MIDIIIFINRMNIIMIHITTLILSFSLHNVFKINNVYFKKYMQPNNNLIMDNNNDNHDEGYTADDIFNNTFKNIKSVNYDQKNDIWIVDLNFKNIYEMSYPDINDNVDKNNTNFPSFNEYMRKSNESFNKLVKDTAKVEKRLRYEYADLKLIKSTETMEWSKTWIYSMVNSGVRYPQFMYQDMFLMRDYAVKNNSKKYLYISYFPSTIRSVHGPHYIVAVEIVPKKREFQVQLIVQNPNYMIESEYDEKKIVDFKNQLIALSRDSDVFFEFSQLKDISNPRYYYSWLYA